MTKGTQVVLSESWARCLTDEVKADAAALWAKLLELYEGGAHTALGYSSWGAYYEAEFGQSKQQGYRILDAARAVDALQSPMGDSPVSERVARELVPLRKNPEEITAVWRKVQGEHGGNVTARVVQQAVAAVRGVPHAGRKQKRDDGPSHVLPNVLPGATPEGELHELIVTWCHAGRDIASRMNSGIRPTEAPDPTVLLEELQRVSTLAARLRKEVKTWL